MSRAPKYSEEKEKGKFGMRETLKSAVRRFRLEIKIYQLVLRDSRTPRLSKWLLWLVIAYGLSPIDLIPDFIPVLGQLDDLIIVPALVGLALWFIPDTVLEDCRAAAKID